MDERWKWAYQPGTASIHEHVFLVEVGEGAEPMLSFEHDAYEWAAFDRAMGLLKWPNNRRALEFCNRLLQREGEEP